MESVKPADIRWAAMNLLARREHSRTELQQKLSRRFSDHELIAQQIDLLTEEKLQCDERFTEVFINSKKSSGKGPMRIRQELKQKGIHPELIEMFLDDSDDEWRELARETYSKKFGDGAVTDQKEKAKRIRFMQYRGFSTDIIFRLIDG